MYHYKTFSYIYNWVQEVAAYLTLVTVGTPFIMLVFFWFLHGWWILHFVHYCDFLYALGSS